MPATGGRLTSVLTGMAIAMFVVLLIFALTRLAETEKGMRRNVGDNMLWTIVRAQKAALELDGAVARKAGLRGSTPELKRRYNVLLSRLNLLLQGPQRRYMARLGQLSFLENHEPTIRALGPDIDNLGYGDRARAEAIHEVLAPLAKRVGRAANKSMVRHWNTTGERLDTQRATLFQVIVCVLAILALGAFLCISMLRTMAQKHHAERSLVRAREISEAYRSFVALVSHQFRTPLSVIDSAMQRLLRRGASVPGEEIAERARQTRAEVHGLVQLIDTTLDSMRIDAGEVDLRPADCEIATLLESVRTRQLETTPARTIRLLIDDAVPARMMTDPVLLTQILDNLVSNAVKYSPATEPVTIRTTAESGHIVFCVEDAGPGILPGEQDRLFHRFFRASTASGVPGTGIGLSISDQLARVMGGNLDFESRRGIGSTFTLTLPERMAAPAQEPGPRKARKRRVPSPRLPRGGASGTHRG